VEGDELEAGALLEGEFDVHIVKAMLLGPMAVNQTLVTGATVTVCIASHLGAGGVGRGPSRAQSL
jgi:hypothetical protein